MADGFRTKTTGLDKIERKMLRIADECAEYRAQVTSRATVGAYKRVYGAPESESRSAGKNITIFRTQALKGRDVVFTDIHESAEINDVWQMGVVDVINTEKKDVLFKRTWEVANLLEKYTKRHILKEQARHGKIDPVKPGTQKRKDREGLKKGLPPLIRTGQLIRSFIPNAKIKKIAGSKPRIK